MAAQHFNAARRRRFFHFCRLPERTAARRCADGRRFTDSAGHVYLISLADTLDQWFTLEISASGETIYTPTKYNGYNRTNLPPQGVPVKGRISREELMEIVREFENQKFFALKDSYEDRDERLSGQNNGCRRQDDFDPDRRAS